jgi:hypothetical protein
MSNKRTETNGPTSATAPRYASWRGQLLAELALARIPGMIVNKRPARQDTELDYDFLVATEAGFCFFVKVNAFSSAWGGSADLEAAEEWCWDVDLAVLERAHTSRSPFLLFLFDADSEEGRFLRLDVLPLPPKGRTVTVRLPADNAIDREKLEKLIESLEKPSPRRR